MMRSATPRASQLGKLELSSGSQQRRLKSFVKRVDKNNEVYYTPAKNGLAYNQDRSKEYSFFEMPNLLLDLDAEGTRGVRSFEEADEELMKTNTKWTEPPRRAVVKAKVKQFQEQIHESRRKRRDVLSQPTNPWRITPHDLFSAAILGASSINTVDKTVCNAADIIGKVSYENGIPPHATTQDEHLLEWMLLLRRNQEETPQPRKQTAPSPAQLAEALKSQSSITAIRRLVFQCLSTGMSISHFQKQSTAHTDAPWQIRSACERILEAHPARLDVRYETLAFLGNLSERMLLLDVTIGPLLCGLALRLSAEVGSLRAMSEWLFRSRAIESSGNSVSRADVRDTLRSLQVVLSNEGEVDLNAVESRQLLFQLLTGLDENNAITSESFRALIITAPPKNSSTDAQAVAFDTYEAYITLLGHLGAVGVLWKEWRTSAQVFAKHAGQVSSENGNIINECFKQALSQAAHVMAVIDDELPLDEDVSLEKCATMDYHVIEAQDASRWQSKPNSGNDKSGRSSVNLDKSLRDFVRELQKI